jgi:hypothetical protein
MFLIHTFLLGERARCTRGKGIGQGDPGPATINLPLISIMIAASPWLALLVLLIHPGSSVFLYLQLRLRF